MKWPDVPKMGDERTIYVVCKLRVQSTKYKVGGIDCIKMHILYDTSKLWKSKKITTLLKNCILSSKMTRIQFNDLDHDVYCNIKYYVTRCLTNYVTKSWIFVCKANPKEPYLSPEFWIRYLWRRTVHVINSII